MRTGPIAAAIVSLLVALGTAEAQQTSTTTTRPTDLKKVVDESLVVQPFNLSVDKIKRMDVVMPNGEQIGDIANVLVDSTGRVSAMTVNTAGFLGLGAKEYVMPLRSLQVRGEKFMTDLTQAEIEKLPAYED